MRKILTVLLAAGFSSLLGVGVAVAQGGVEGVNNKVIEIKADVAAGKAAVAEIKQDIKDAKVHAADDVKNAKAHRDNVEAEANIARDKVKAEVKARN